MGSGIHRLLEKNSFETTLLSARKIISGDSSDSEEIHRADLVIEASSESQIGKLQILKILSELNTDGVIATTTSSLSISDLSESINDPSRFCGLHFMNPVSVIAATEFTYSSIFSISHKDTVLRFLGSLNRIVFETQDQPGFVLNALLFPFLNRAVYMLESSKLSASEIDLLITKVCGHKLGPLATLDLIGLDVSLEIMNILHLREPQFNIAPSTLLTSYVKDNRLGKKVGHGFYEY